MNEENENEKKSFTFVDKRHVDSEEKNGEDAAKPEDKASDLDDKPEKAIETVSEETAPEESGPAGAPPIDFTTFVLSLSSSALYHMGGFQDPVSGKTSINLDLAKQTIDIIGVLKDKTTGNLDESEIKLIDSMLYDLKMKFVEVSKGPSSK